MLPKKNRVSRALFATILKSGKVFHSNNISFRIVKTQKAVSKFSFVVSRKVSKSAVIRNLLRRRGYFVVQTAFEKEKMNASGILGAFFLKKGAEKLNFASFRDEIISLLGKSGIT